jgi:predicted Fe-Mo cluster-binding NifX family protein
MKIAVASEGDLVSQHFGHCANFNVYELENSKIISSRSVQNGDHENGCVPDFLKTFGVTLIITGGIGGGAVANLNRQGIDVIRGAKGGAQEAVEKYLSGKLISTGELCAEHEAHHGQGSDAHQCSHHGS